jgi:hypothetical protein
LGKRSERQQAISKGCRSFKSCHSDQLIKHLADPEKIAPKKLPKETGCQATSVEESPSPVPNGIVLTLPRLHRQAAAKLCARNDPDTAELAEAHEGAAQLLQERKDLRRPPPARE